MGDHGVPVNVRDGALHERVPFLFQSRAILLTVLDGGVVSGKHSVARDLVPVVQPSLPR